MKTCIKKKTTDFQDSQKLMALMVASDDVHNRVLFCFQNLLEQLPLEPISQKVDESELITRYVTAAINPLLENLMKHVMFHWTSVDNDECKSSEMSLLLARPDSMVSMIIGTEIGQTVGFGEVKPALQTLNHKLVGKDLVRLALLAKNAINTYRSKFVLFFLVVSKSRDVLFD
ncbi:hypothetical protein F4703DRAFT_1551447 [Phycomyces blakesleeanus]